MREVPFSVDDTKRNIFVWRPCTEEQQDCVIVAGFFDNFIRGGFGLVDEVRIEDVELCRLSAFDTAAN